MTTSFKVQKVNEAGIEKLTKFVSDVFRGICRTRRKQINSQRGKKWDVPDAFIQWYNRREEKGDKNVDETMRPSVQFPECHDSDFEDDEPAQSQQSQSKKRKIAK
jgi:hypothetical protein